MWAQPVGRCCWQGVQGKVKCGAQHTKKISPLQLKARRVRSTSRRTLFSTNTHLQARRTQLPLVSGTKPRRPPSEASLGGVLPTTRDRTALRTSNLAADCVPACDRMCGNTSTKAKCSRPSITLSIISMCTTPFHNMCIIPSNLLGSSLKVNSDRNRPTVGGSPMHLIPWQWTLPG